MSAPKWFQQTVRYEAIQWDGTLEGAIPVMTFVNGQDKQGPLLLAVEDETILLTLTAPQWGLDGTQVEPGEWLVRSDPDPRIQEDVDYGVEFFPVSASDMTEFYQAVES